ERYPVPRGIQDGQPMQRLAGLGIPGPRFPFAFIAALAMGGGQEALAVRRERQRGDLVLTRQVQERFAGSGIEDLGDAAQAGNYASLAVRGEDSRERSVVLRFVVLELQ